MRRIFTSVGLGMLAAGVLHNNQELLVLSRFRFFRSVFGFFVGFSQVGSVFGVSFLNRGFLFGFRFFQTKHSFHHYRVPGHILKGWRP